MESLSLDLHRVLLAELRLSDIANLRASCKFWRETVSQIASIEKIPELLLVKNYKQLSGIAHQDAVPLLQNQKYWYSCSGKMNADVWKSPLVQWLLKRDELDSLPWREFIVLRVADLFDNGYPKSDSPSDFDRLGMGTELQTQPPVLVLPTEPEDGGGVFCHRVIPFNFHTWQDHIPHFETASDDYALNCEYKDPNDADEAERSYIQLHNTSVDLWNSLESWARAQSADPTAPVVRWKLESLQAPATYGIAYWDHYIVQQANVILAVFVDLC